MKLVIANRQATKRNICRMSKKTKEILDDAELHDSWRYIGKPEWYLDFKGSYDPPEIKFANEPAEEEPERECFILDHLQKRLNERQYQIVYQYIWEGRSMADIAKDFGVSRVRVYQIYQGALAVLKMDTKSAAGFRKKFIGS